MGPAGYAGGQMGCAVQSAPPIEHATAAQLWAEAKERLERTGNAQYEAEQAHAKAKAEEADAWNRLESVAGRSVPKSPTCDAKPYAPPAGYR